MSWLDIFLDAGAFGARMNLEEKEKEKNPKCQRCKVLLKRKWYGWICPKCGLRYDGLRYDYGYYID